MHVPELLKDPILKSVDTFFALIPRPQPSRARLESCRIVSHRGERDGIKTKENTLVAFRAAVEGGAWGIEFDLRWTKDDEPIVHHDLSTLRVFGRDVLIQDMTFAEIRKEFPDIPSLSEVIEAFPNTHLMIELKKDELGLTTARLARLKQELFNRKPVEDYHLMSLDLHLLLKVDFATKKALLPVAEINVAEMVRLSQQYGFDGLTGQYALLSDKAIAQLKAFGLKSGTGFASSRSVLYREINRDIDWVFTNHAVAMRRHITEALASS